MDKADIRRELIGIRGKIENRTLKNRLICERTLNLLKDFEKIFIYVSFGSEVSTHEIIGALSSKTVYVPHTMRDKTMHAVLIGDNVDLSETDGFGNVTADNGKYYDGQADSTVVPLLGFNEHNFRLGYGAGCYDKYFAKYNGGLKIGLAYEEQFRCFNQEDTDVPMDIIITPERIIGRNI